MFKINGIILTISLLLSTLYVFGNKNSELSISNFVDETNSLSFDQIQKENFTPATSNDLNIGFNNKTHWFQIDITQEKTEKDLIQFLSPELDSISIYFLKGTEVLGTKHSGLLLAFKDREFKNRLPTFSIPPETQKVFIKVRSELPINFNLKLQNSTSYNESYTLDLILFSLVHFSILLVLLYNLVLFLRLKESLYGYYSLYLLALFITGLSITGFINQFIFSSGESINYWFVNMAVSSMLITFTLFTNHVLKFRENLKLFHLLFKGLIISGVICFFSSPFLDRAIVAKALHIFPGISMVLAAIGAAIILRKGFKPAKFYLIGWSFFFLGALLMQTHGWGYITDYVWYTNVSFIGAALQMIFFSFTVSETIKNYMNEIEQSKSKINSSQKELDSLRQQLIKHQEEGISLSQTPINKKINNNLLTPLSTRELEVLTLLAKGKTNKIVAEELFVSVNTIKTHIRNIYEKLDVKNRTEAVNKASNLELI